MTPADVADSLDAAAGECTKLAHDIRQRRSPGYSDTPTDLTDMECARTRAIAEILDPAMRIAHAQPAAPQQPPVLVPAGVPTDHQPQPVDEAVGPGVVEQPAAPVAEPVADPAGLVPDGEPKL